MTLIHGAGATIVVIETVFSFLALVAVLLRVWARRLKKRQLALNDWAAMAALFFNFCLAAVQYETTTAGMGQHVQDLANPEGQVVTIIKSLLALETLWATVNAFVKISILHLYTTIFVGKRFMMTVYTIMAMSVSYAVSVLLQNIFLCRPIAKNWDKTISGSCGNTTQAYEAFGIINLLIDLAIVILPMPLLWGLQLPVPKKVALTAIFGVGFLICVISAIRVESLARWDFTDISWGMWKVAVWSTLEPTLGIVNCCLPVLGPVAETAHSSAIWARCIGKKGCTPRGRTSCHKALYRDGGENDVETRRFKRLADHSFPLKNISGTTSDESRPNFQEPYSNFEDDNPSSHLKSKNAATHGVIRVQRDWDVEHL